MSFSPTCNCIASSPDGVRRFPLPDESHLHTVWTGTASCGQFSRVPRNKVCVVHSWTALMGPSLLPPVVLMGQLPKVHSSKPSELMARK